MIEVKNLTKTYKIRAEKHNKSKQVKDKIKKAVTELSFIAEPGKITGLIGENGAGKTTTMRILTTLIQPTTGVAKINDIDVVARPEAIRSEIGVLFGGDPVLYDNLTARENIMYYAELNGMSQAAANNAIDLLAERLDMSAYINQKAKGFSRGMKQKVAIARTIVHNPSVIIFDEPTTGLDVSTSRIIYDFLEEYRLQGKTILLSSHSMYEVERLCDTVIIIHKGTKMAEGTVASLLSIHEEERFEDLFIRLTGGSIDETN